MSQSATVIEAGLDGTTQRLRINEANVSLATCYYGPVDPTSIDGVTVEPGFVWWNTGVSPTALYVRNDADDDWVDLLDIDGAPGTALQALLDAKLDLGGGVLTNFLTLHADPTSALHAATKQYVDATSRPAPVRWYVTGTASVQTNVAQVVLHQAASAVGMRLWSDTAPVGADLEVSVVRKRAGSADDSASGTITAGNNSATATFSPALALLAGDRLRLDVTQVGSGTAGGNDLLVTVQLDPP